MRGMITPPHQNVPSGATWTARLISRVRHISEPYCRPVTRWRVCWRRPACLERRRDRRARPPVRHDLQQDARVTEPKLVGLWACTLMATYVRLGGRQPRMVFLSCAARELHHDGRGRPRHATCPTICPPRRPRPSLSTAQAHPDLPSSGSATRDPISTFARTKRGHRSSRRKRPLTCEPPYGIEP